MVKETCSGLIMCVKAAMCVFFNLCIPILHSRILEGGGYRAEGNKGEKKWDNCNSIINKIYLKYCYEQ